MNGKPIMKKGVRILRPTEYEKLRQAIPKHCHKTALDALLTTGMRYVEAQRLQKNPEWFDGKRINLPVDSCNKGLVTKPRTIILNRYSRQHVIPYFLRDELPCRSGWNANLKRWVKDAGIDQLESKGLCASMTRKTWNTWLILAYPNYFEDIIKNMGHDVHTTFCHDAMSSAFTECNKRSTTLTRWI